jgi:N-formylglutamate amidohydrolase
MIQAPLPILITLPHCSGEMPEEIFARMRECGEPEAALRQRIFWEGDPFTDTVYDIPARMKLPAAYSRFAVDLNRERGEGGPNGVLKTVDFQLRPFYASSYRILPEERERRLQAYYDPYHRAVEECLAKKEIRFLLDGHSLTAQGPMMGPDQGRPRPALCLGNFGNAQGEPVNGIPVSFPPAGARLVRDYAVKVLTDAFPHWDRNNLALLNQPFDGGHILERYSHPSYPHRVPGLLFEINRNLYLDEKKGEPLPGAIEIWQRIVLDLASFILKNLA